jgi:hypothetical protein
MRGIRVITADWIAYPLADEVAEKGKSRVSRR